MAFKSPKTPKGSGAVERKGSYRPVEHTGGPYYLEQGPNGDRESPRMKKPIEYYRAYRGAIQPHSQIVASREDIARSKKYDK
jgi:hypothetical protein